METIDEIKQQVARLVDVVAILKQLVEMQGNRIKELENALHELDPKYYNRPPTG